MKIAQLSHGWRPADINAGDTILLIKVKSNAGDRLILAQDYDQHCEGNKAQPAKISHIEKFGGCWMLKTSIGDTNLTNNNNGYVTFVK